MLILTNIGLAWWLYAVKPAEGAEAGDPLERIQPDVFALLRDKFLVDELYDATVVRANAASARLSDWLDGMVWGGLVRVVSYAMLGLSLFNGLLDRFVVNLGFDRGCGSLRASGGLLSRFQNGQVRAGAGLPGAAEEIGGASRGFGFLFCLAGPGRDALEEL